MLCPNCHADYTTGDTYCYQCGNDLTSHSTSIVVTPQRNLPTLFSNPAVPRSVAAGVGALVLGAGIELLRRALLARLSPPARPAENALPALNGLRDMLLPHYEKQQTFKLPRGYEIQETVVYMRRVIRRQD